MEECFKDMNVLPAFAELTELAQLPYDLTLPESLTPERISSYVCRGGGVELLFSTQRVDESVLEKLQQLADQSCAVDLFLRMKKGEVINRIEGFESENRQVLHTATRDIFSEDPYAPEATGQAMDELYKLEQFLAGLEDGSITNAKGKRFSHLVNIGIGGSDLGPRAVYLALKAFSKKERQAHFISNVDPDDAAEVLETLDLSRTLVNVVSKSGSTLETLSNEKLVRRFYERAGLDPKNHFLAVTGKGSPMDNPEKYLRSFYMFDYIGGRYSSTSMVGAVMLGFVLGFESLRDFLRGANTMDKAAEDRNILANPALLLAMLGIWNRNFLGYDTVAILPYSQALIRFTAHLQQCDMESNGKSCRRTGGNLTYKSGPIVWGEPGTNGQHAFYQLLHQGTTVVPVEFIGFRKSQRQEDIDINGTSSQEKLLANLLAQALAMATGRASDNPNRNFAGNRPSSVLMADRLDPFTMGILLALYEAKIVFQGFVWNINSFDQEGVQLGKILANRLLEHMAAQKAKSRYKGTKDDPIAWSLLKTAGVLNK